MMNVEKLLKELDHFNSLTPNFLLFRGCWWLFLNCAAGLSGGIKCYGQSVSGDDSTQRRDETRLFVVFYDGQAASDPVVFTLKK